MVKVDDSVKLSTLGTTEYLTTGIESVDTLLGGGFARGRLTEVWGNPGTGKSYLLSKTLAALSDKQKAIYYDSEFALYAPRLEKLGVNMDRVDIVQDSRLERVTEHLIAQVGLYDLIIIDSLAKFIPMMVDANEVGENAIGLFARQVKHFEAKLKPRLARSTTAVVVINQARAGLGMMQPSKPQGGFAWEHGVDIRLKLSKGANNRIVQQSNGVSRQVGHRVTIAVEKSRITQPFISTTFDLLY